METSQSNSGCALIALGMVAGFAAIEGGVLLVAVALHRILGAGEYHPLAMAGAIAGVLLVFAGPRLWFLATRAWPKVTAAQALAASPDLVLAGWFVLGWAAPQAIGKEAAGMLAGLMVLEFVIIHASIALVALPLAMARRTEAGPWWTGERTLSGGLLALYALFAGAVSAAYQTGWLFVMFWLLMANKFIGDWLTPAAQAGERLQRHAARWAVSAGLYLFLAFGSVLIPVPRLGAISASQGEGVWELHPEQAVMMGALYFALLGFCELYGGFNRAPARAAPGAG